MMYTYLLVNFLSIIICFIFSYHHKIQFNLYFKPFIISAIIVAIPFIIGDAIFTKMGVWWFNYDYVLGFKIYNLPIEEILFFLCIPFACIYTYYCLNKFFNLSWNKKIEDIFTLFCVAFCITVASMNTEQIYTFVTFFSCALLMVILKFVIKVNWIGNLAVVYGILMLPFFIVNGVLTGTGLENPIVNYNPQNFMGIRILTVPLEDAVYGYNMIALNLLLFNYLAKIKQVN